jgi:hypothetical protein
MKHTLLYSFSILLYLAVFALIGYIYIKERQSKKAQDKLIDALDKNACINWFRIRISRPAFFRRTMKMVGSEGRAVLINMADQVRIVAELGKGEMLDRLYSKSDLNLQWLGNPGLYSANMHWISLGRDDDALIVSADTGINAMTSRESTADICRMIAPEFQLPVEAKQDFALEKNKSSLTLIVLFFLVVAYAILDGLYFSQHELINLDRAMLFMPSILIFAFPAYLLLVRGKVPSRESIVLTMLFVFALGFSFIPFIKRMDQSLAADGLQTYDYKLISDTRLESVKEGPPDLNFQGAKEYWAQYEKDSIHQFQFVHGPFGLWQLEQKMLNEKYDAFYEKLDSAKKK